MRTKFGLAVAIPALMLALAACGSKQGSDIPTANGTGAAPAATGSVPSDERKQRALKFAECMREHGVDMPDPNGAEFLGGEGVEGVSKDKLNAATEACRQYMPTDNELRTPSAQDVEQMRKLAQCMREHGIANFPDPGPDGSVSLGGTGIDPKDAAFKAAEEACKDLRLKPSGSGA
ncbi:hypothetical protein KZZ52_15065 [Dactylosporangium sp. AC04546]|uniref:hypothetical protein n=1 Tax=Dactylosporangium sp. AC04546 TaxID=2862460 RepID=UPI001EE0BB85|nr:hypothetical protein [Dactylosporangium sp. AC04546]WVK86632.1 hypothetical protein KZZ52_15065 [Dactylosporangium sp. AC04546]